MKKNNSDTIVAFLQQRPLISIHQLEDRLGIPQSTIAKAVKGVRNIPEKHQEGLINELKKYGYGSN
jgi:transcriptional antiterminator